MFANEIRPYKSNAYHRHKSCDALRVAHVGLLDVESGGFHGLESRLNLPALLIGHDCILGTVEAYEDLQFGDSVGVLYPAPGKIDIFTFVKEDLIVEFLLPDPEVIEEPPCTYPLAGGRLHNPEVLPDTDVIPDASVVEPSEPFLSDKLPVGHQAIDTVLSEKVDEPLHDFPAFLPIGIASFRKKAEISGKAMPLYVTPSISMLMLNSPNFQLVRPMLNTSSVLTGSSENIMRAIMSRSRTYLAKNL